MTTNLAPSIINAARLIRTSHRHATNILNPLFQTHTYTDHADDQINSTFRTVRTLLCSVQLIKYPRGVAYTFNLWRGMTHVETWENLRTFTVSHTVRPFNATVCEYLGCHVTKFTSGWKQRKSCSYKLSRCHSAGIEMIYTGSGPPWVEVPGI